MARIYPRSATLVRPRARTLLPSLGAYQPAPKVNGRGFGFPRLLGPSLPRSIGKDGRALRQGIRKERGKPRERPCSSIEEGSEQPRRCHEKASDDTGRAATPQRHDLVMTEGFGLEVDGRMKTVFPTLEAAQKRGRDLKPSFRCSKSRCTTLRKEVAGIVAD